MNINDYILKEIRALSPNDTVKKAKGFCESYSISHFPVVDENKLLGCFSDEDIRTLENDSETIINHYHLFNHFFASASTHLLDLIALFADNNSNLIPVLNQKQDYVGYYDLCDILDVFADSPFLHRDNDTLIVSKNKNEFSMSEIAQIIESNTAKLLGLYISVENTNDVEVTVKVSSNQINEIIQTFRRYEYNVLSEHVDDHYLEELKDRANYLKKYLDM